MARQQKLYIQKLSKNSGQRSISTFSQTQVVDLSDGKTNSPSHKKEKVDFAEKLLGHAGDEYKSGLGTANFKFGVTFEQHRKIRVCAPSKETESFPFRMYTFGVKCYLILECGNH